MLKKKKIKVSIGSVKKVKAGIPAEDPKAAHFRELMQTATDPKKMLEYRFWMEVHQGKNPDVPVHMR